MKMREGRGGEGGGGPLARVLFDWERSRLATSCSRFTVCSLTPMCWRGGSNGMTKAADCTYIHTCHRPRPFLPFRPKQWLSDILIGGRGVRHLELGRQFPSMELSRSVTKIVTYLKGELTGNHTSANCNQYDMYTNIYFTILKACTGLGRWSCT